MGMEIVTGYTGEPHIRPEDDGARNAGIFGTGKYVLNVGRKFAVEIVSNNMVKIKDGDLINQGRHIRIPVGETEECTIENGTQARYRNDLIVSRYSKESGSEGKESAKIVVIKGTASTSSTPPDPSYTSGDILNGALTDDFPLYRVRLNGLSITAVEPLFGNPVKSLSELNTDMGDTENDIKSVNNRIDDLMYQRAYGYNNNGSTKTFYIKYEFRSGDKGTIYVTCTRSGTINGLRKYTLIRGSALAYSTIQQGSGGVGWNGELLLNEGGSQTTGTDACILALTNVQGYAVVEVFSANMKITESYFA